MSDVTAVTSHFATANEDFNTSTSSVTNAGANTVGFNTIGDLVDGSVFVGVIEPGTAKEQVFTGIVDLGGSRITGVVWTKGSNVEHANGVSVVDYDTGTSQNMFVKGMLVQHKQDGTHANTITTNTINENTVANGVTVDGVKLKDGIIATTQSVPPSALNTGGTTAFVATREDTALSSYTDLATPGPSVTVDIGANGIALVGLSMNYASTTTYAAGEMAFAISGASTVAASNNFSAGATTWDTSGAATTASGVFIVTGLTAGSTTFKAQYRTSLGTGTFQRRRISVVPL